MKKTGNSSSFRPLGVSLSRYASALALCAALAAGRAPVDAGIFYWDNDGNTANNTLAGAGLGGSGAWNLISAKWWDGVSVDGFWPNTTADIAIFAGTAGTLTLGGAITASELRFISDGYAITGSTLTLASGAVGISFSNTEIISSQLTGSGDLTLTGGGALRLKNTANNFTGGTTIRNGSLIISNAAALGTPVAGSEKILINGSTTRGFGGGSLVLDGDYGSGVTLSRAIDVMGFGPISDRGAALISVKNNMLTGTVARSEADTTVVLSRIFSAGGLLTFSGTVSAPGTAGTGILSLGGINAVGAGNFAIVGPASVLTGTGTLEKTGAGTLTLSPSDSLGFGGTIRISGGGNVRLVSNNTLGTRTTIGTGSVLDMNGGTLEVRMDAPAITVGAVPTAALVYQRGTNSTIFVDHSLGGSAILGTATFGALTFEENQTLNLNGRNGYGITFPEAAVNGGNASSVITNNLNGVLAFTGDFWSNTDNALSRTMTIGGNGDTLISGNVIASSVAFDHNLIKIGNGTLTLSGTASTLDGSVNIQAGTLQITDFRAINKQSGTTSTGAINLGAATVAGALIISGVAPAAGDITSSRVLSLAGTSGGANIYANQTGSTPVIFSANLTATGAGSKVLRLGGTNTADNTIGGVIPDNGAGNLTSVTKIGPGTWALNGTNVYSGATTITGGALKLKASAAASNIIPSAATNTIVFGTDAFSQSAGGTLEFVGVAAATTETLGTLTPTSGTGTVKVTSGAGGATLTFASLGTRGSGAGLNFNPGTGAIKFTGVVAGINGIVGGFATINGTDFVTSVAAGGSVAAPAYTAGGAQFNSTPPATTGSATVNYFSTGTATTGNYAANSLKLLGGSFTGTGVLTMRGASATSVGGILFVNSASAGGISGFTGIATSTANQELIFYTGGTTPANAFTVASPLTNGTGAVTKGGDGTMVLTGSSTFTGNLFIDEGTLKPSGATANLLGVITTSGNVTTIRQAGTLDINGAGVVAIPYAGAPASFPTITLGALNGGGSTSAGATTGAKITNTGTVASAISIGSATSTANGYYTGIIQDGSRQLTLIKDGAGVESLTGLNTYSGATVINAGTLAVTNLANISLPSSIGTGVGGGNAASLVFNGGTLLYTGATGTIFQNTGTPSVSIDRLFTLAGNGTIDSQGSFGNNVLARTNNNAALVFNNPAPVAFAGTGARTLTLQGDSTGDNRINLLLADNPNGPAALTLAKSGTGLWVLGNPSNSYSGPTVINGGVLRANSGTTLPASSNLTLNGGVFESAGTLARSIGTTGTQLQIQAPAANTARFAGGFAASDSKLSVTLGGVNPVWGSTAGFVSAQDGMVLNSVTALSEVDITSSFSLGSSSSASAAATVTTAIGNATVTLTSGTTAGLVIGQPISGTSIPLGAYVTAINSATTLTMNVAAGTGAGTGIAATLAASPFRAIRVDDNATATTDLATISGVISGAAGTGIRKAGAGILQLVGQNTYSGETSAYQGILVVNSLGNSAAVASTSVGTSASANLASNAVTLGDGGSGAAILQYVGSGETSDRRVRLNTTTGLDEIHADGSGTLVLTNVTNDMAAGAKTLRLRGSNAQANQVSGTPLADNGGALGITVDGAATWVLSGNNSYTGTTTVSSGALGVGSNTAFGTGTVALSGGSYFAYGADRTLANVHTQATNTTVAFIGDYSLTINGTFQSLATTTNVVMTNNIGASGLTTGKALTLGAVTFDVLSGIRTWTINGSGDTAIKGPITNSVGTLNFIYNSTGTLTLGGTNTYNGATNLQRSTTILAGGSNGHLPATTALTLGSIPATGAASAILQLGDASGASNVTLSSVSVAGGNANAIVGGNSLAIPSVLTLSPTVDFTMPVPIGGNATDPVQNNIKLVKTGAATVTLSQTNWYTGSTDVGTPNGIDGGILALSGGAATLGNIFTPPTTLNVYGGTADLGVTTQTVSDLNLGGGAAGSTARVNVDGDLTVGRNIIYSATNNPNPATISGSGGLNFTPALPASDSTILVGSSAAGSGGALAPDLTINAAIKGSTDIHKVGAGTLRLVGNINTNFQAGFFVDAGTLILDASSTQPVLAQGVRVTVGTASAGAKLDFGATSGERTVFNKLTVNNNSALVFNLGAPGVDTSDNLFLVDKNGLTLGTGLKLNINALTGFGVGRYNLVDEQSDTDLGIPFSLGNKPGGFSYTLSNTFDAGTGIYDLFLDVLKLSGGFFWKGAVDKNWNAASNGNWVDSGGVVINGAPGLVNDVTFSATAPTNQANTVVNVNLGVKTLTISDALVASIKGSAGTILSIADQLLINGSVGSVALGSGTVGEELFIGVASNTQRWTNNGTGTLTVWNQVFSQVSSGTQSLTFDGSGNSVIKGNIINGGLGGKIQVVQGSASTLTLENTGNTYTGGTVLSGNGGVIEFKAGALPLSGKVDFTANATLRWLTGNTDDVSSALIVRGARTATLDVGANDVNFATPIQVGNPTNGIFRKAGSGTLTMANTVGGGYSGGTEIADGTLQFVSGALPASTGNISFIGNSSLKWSTGNTDDISDRLRIADAVNGTLNTNGNDVTFNNAPILNGAASTGSLTKDGLGTLTLNQAIIVAGSGHSGGTNIAGGTLQFATGALPATGTVKFTGNSTLMWSAGNTTDISGRLQINSGVTGTLDTNGNNVTFTLGVLPSPGNLTKAGAGTLTFAATNPGFTGATNVSAGTLAVSGGLSGTTAVTVSQGATFQLQGAGANLINAAAAVTMGTGTVGTPATLVTNGANQALGVLTLAGPAVIDFKGFDASAQLRFANSAGTAWSGSLSIFNWTGNVGSGGGADQLFFGSDSSGLAGTQLPFISFFSDDGQSFLGNAMFASAGEVVPIPEPAGFVALFSGIGTLLALRRRRHSR